MTIEFLNFEDVVQFALMQIQQVAAGCPVDCSDSPWNCDKDENDMPPYCKNELNEFLIMEKLEMNAMDELIHTDERFMS